MGERDEKVTLKCKLCLGDKFLSAAKNSTSNLKHLKTKHSSTTLVTRSIEEENDADALTQREINEHVAGYGKCPVFI